MNGGTTKKMHVFGKGMLDTLDDVFWMLPFSSKKQAQIIRQENNMLDDVWEKRRDKIMAEHRLPHAREQLAQQWKEWIAQDSFKDRREAATRVQAAAELPEFDE
jgi:methionine salvage enolase-phosphatase E1